MTTLDPRLLLQGYAMGIFPMADSRQSDEVFWVEPRSRAVIPLDRFHLSHSLRRTVRSGKFRVTLDTAFADVVIACADRPAPRGSARPNKGSRGGAGAANPDPPKGHFRPPRPLHFAPSSGLSRASDRSPRAALDIPRIACTLRQVTK